MIVIVDSKIDSLDLRSLELLYELNRFLEVYLLSFFGIFSFTSSVTYL